MKRLFAMIILLAIILTTAPGWAAWTLTPSIVGDQKHRLYWQVVCVSDGDALPATDLVALMDSTLRERVQESTLLVMNVIPGSGSVAPDTTINVILGHSSTLAFYTATGFSYTANTVGNDLSEDYTIYPPVYNALYLTLNDIGAAGDTVTLTFECWIEEEYK